MIELFNRISASNKVLDGWCSEEKAITLASLIVAFRPALIVEIGIYGGKSLIPMAMACQAVNSGIVIGIDPWSNEIAIREQTTQEDKDWWQKNVDLEKIRTNFYARVAEYKLEKFIHVERKESKHVPAPSGISVLHVDGAHSDTAMYDIVKFAPKVIAGGYCVTDDSNWQGGGVARGEERLKDFGFSKIAPLGTGAVFQRLKL